MDARKKKVLIVLAIASVILVWRLYAIVTEYLPSTTRADSVAEVVPAAKDQTSVRKDSMEEVWNAQTKVTEQSWGRDPFSNVLRVLNLDSSNEEVVSREPPPAPSILFTGVSMSDDQWLAALDGNIVRVGDTVEEDCRIIEITKHSVVLKSKGWVFTYALGSQKPEIRPFSEEP
ncbi:MAG: hypothetical protein MI923_14710 [Phycisphaerales bacterium]|nr:hypothetical protein [Phycisphaerales bacterium]